ncbi:hypothetical protein, partial [Blautia obeum]|uniref:hypothetical protein n=1 Tax=Blautia obeum TaxID=40520 RepID=UPI00319E287D
MTKYLLLIIFCVKQQIPLFFKKNMQINFFDIRKHNSRCAHKTKSPVRAKRKALESSRALHAEDG